MREREVQAAAREHSRLWYDRPPPRCLRVLHRLKLQIGTPSGCPAFVPGTERHDVMGYHTDTEIPNYWAYARNFVLQDEMFEAEANGARASHLLHFFPLQRRRVGNANY